MAEKKYLDTAGLRTLWGRITEEDAEILSQIAATYSSSSTYALEDFCIYNGNLYQCTTAITTAEDWTAAHWTSVDVATVLNSIKSSVALVSTNLSNLTYSDVGAAAASHGTHVTYSATNPAMNGTASAGSANTVSRSDHVHPSDTSRVPTTRTVNGKALSANITLNYSDVGAAAASHGTHVTFGSNVPNMDGTASAGSSSNVARADHVHPVDTSRAAATHSHAAGDITSGTLAVARLPEMTAASSGSAGTSGIGPAPAAGAQEKFLKANGTWDTTTKALSLTASASGWSGSGPYTQTLTATGVTASNNIQVGTGGSLTSAQQEAFSNAQLVCTAQASNSITLTAFGDMPSVALPITVMILG